MSGPPNRVFISYRRDDAAGYAGRLEEALEERLGRGSVFRDVLDIAPGEDFVHAIRTRLAGAQAVLVLIGRRWAGGDGTQRRIDDPDDFVRLEVATALDGPARVLPVLIGGATMPAEHQLPDDLKPLARRNALSLNDNHWDADIARLVAGIGLPPPRRVWPVAIAAAVLAAAAVAGLCTWRAGDAQRSAAAASAAAAEAEARWLGRWSAEVNYGWARHNEVFEFKRHAGQLTGTASFLGSPRGVQNLRIEGANLRFETRTQESVGDKTYDLTHAYSAELRGSGSDELLSLRMHTTGGFGGSRKPLEFEARRSR